MALPAIDIKKLRIGVLLNRASGSCDADSEAKIVGILQQAGIVAAEVKCVAGAELEAALDAFTRSRIAVLVVLGGDGTIRAAAEKCGAADIMLIALPGGTMNMLPKALYGANSWEKALTDTLADPQVLQVSGGEVEKYRFFCAGIFGSPSLWAGAREAIRANHLVEAIRRILRAYHRTFSQKLRYRFAAGQQGTSTAVVIICPLVSSALASDATALEAAALNPNDSAEAFRLGWSALFSDWRLDASVSTCSTRLVALASRGQMPAILDGEAVRLSRAAEIRFIPDCFKVLVPRRTAA